MAKKKAANLLPKLTETEQDQLSHIQDGYRLGAGLERSPLRQKATRKLQESYRQAYIYSAINDGKIARCSGLVV